MVLDADQLQSRSLNRTAQLQWPARVVRGWIDVRAEVHVMTEIAHRSFAFLFEIPLSLAKHFSRTSESVYVHYILYVVGLNGCAGYLDLPLKNQEFSSVYFLTPVVSIA